MGKNVIPFGAVNKKIEITPDLLVLVTNISYERPTNCILPLYTPLSPVTNGLV